MTVGDRLRVLLVEDVPEDAEKIAAELRPGWPDLDWRRVDTAEGLAAELEAFRPRIVLSGYAMASFDGISALGICLEKSPGTPFVFVTRSMSEETAVACVKAGAADYLTKDHLELLVPAVEAALRLQEARGVLRPNGSA